ncbi:pyridoxal phosphate-dependent transferase [Paraphysoderma sedebokerense]|nr:pyridoxal phosphate-dependent transferase [Paraphysoderma sedebokerense]
MATIHVSKTRRVIDECTDARLSNSEDISSFALKMLMKTVQRLVTTYNLPKLSRTYSAAATSRANSPTSSSSKPLSSQIPLYGRPPIVFNRGKGCYLYDTNGTRYLDMTAGIAVNALGHADTELAEVIYDQAKTLVHTSNLYNHPWSEQLASDLIQSTRRPSASNASTSPSAEPPLSHVFFCNSGTEATEGALKFARLHAKTTFPDQTNKYKILTFSNGFHGRSLGALSATFNLKYQKPFEPLVPGFVNVEFNNLSQAQEVLDNSYCGVIVEPIQGEGGINIASAEFLEGLRKECDRVGALLIFDEVQCGLSRTGQIWAHHHYPTTVTPDILTVAKPLGNGVPIGAVLTSSNVTQSINPGSHGTTFGGSPFACRIGHHVLNRLTAPSFLSHVNNMGEYLEQKLTELSDSPVVKEVRGKGLIWGIEFREPIDGSKIVDMCRDQNLLVVTAGKDARTIRLVPPLIIKKEEIDNAVGVLEKVIVRLEETIGRGNV